VLNVLNELYEAKADSFLAKGDLLAYRICKMVRAWAAMWNTAAQRLPSAYSPSSTPRQRLTKLRAASALGQPRPISLLGRAGRLYRPCFRHLTTYYLLLTT